MRGRSVIHAFLIIHCRYLLEVSGTFRMAPVSKWPAEYSTDYSNNKVLVVRVILKIPAAFRNVLILPVALCLLPEGLLDSSADTPF